MLNFKACGTLLNIMQSSKYFAQNFFIMIGTTSKGGTVKLVTFIFPPLAKGHPNIYIYIYIYSSCYIHVQGAAEQVNLSRIWLIAYPNNKFNFYKKIYTAISQSYLHIIAKLYYIVTPFD